MSKGLLCTSVAETYVTQPHSSEIGLFPHFSVQYICGNFGAFKASVPILMKQKAIESA